MKKLIMMGMALIMVVAMFGCQNESNVDGIEEEVDNSGDGYYISPTSDIAVGEVITAGFIMQFDGEYIHIISGDLVKVFEYDKNQANDFYLNQNVRLIKGEKTNSLEPLIVEDFSTRHTNMGQIIESLTGTVSKVTNEFLIIFSEGEETTIKTYEPQDIVEGTSVTIMYMNFEEDEKSMVSLLNEDSKLILKVKEINRGDKGEMLMLMTDQDDGEYNISTSGCILELNISEIVAGDKLTVYYQNGIMESWPMQLNTVLIKK